VSTTTLPPVPPPGPPSVDEREELEALIKEARRRARRRRSLYAIAAVLAAGSAAAGFSGFHGGGSTLRGAPEESTAGGPQQNRPAPAPRAVRNGPLALVDAATGTRVVLIGAGGGFFRSLPICRPPRCGGLQSVAWSPDGKTLAYGTATGPGGQWHPRDGLHLFDLARNKDRRFIPGANWGLQDLAWSPNGKKLAYVAGHAIYIINLERPKEITALRANSTSPSWSPNGKLIAYQGKGWGITVSRPDGSHSRRLSKFGAAPAWSPSGNLIAYEVRCGIRLMTQTGKDVTPNAVWRCAHIGVPGAPVWSPDGRRIAIGGAKGAFVMNANGSGLTRIWARPALRPSWRPVLRG
jgi:Tol biopolymer transport system component